MADRKSRPTQLVVDGKTYSVHIAFEDDAARHNTIVKVGYRNIHDPKDASWTDAPNDAEFTAIGRKLDAGAKLTTKEMQDMQGVVHADHDQARGA